MAVDVPMELHRQSLRVARLRLFARAASVVVSLGGSLILLAWVFDIPALRAPLPGVATMKANTALAFVLAGLALWLSMGEATRSPRISRMFALAVCLLGLTTLSQEVFGWNLGIDELLFEDATTTAFRPGRMAPATAFCFIALGFGIFASTRRRLVWLAHVLALIVAFVAVVALVGYLYDIEALYTVGAYTTMAVHTAFLLLVLAQGLLCAQPTSGMMAVIVSESFGGLVARRLLPAAFFLPIVLGWVRLEGERSGLYGLAFGVSLMVMSTIVVISAMIWWSAGSLGRLEHDRRQVEEAAHRHLRSVLDSALDGVISIDSTGNVTYWNRRAEVIFGWSAEEALSQDLAALIMPSRYHQHHRRGLEQFLATGEGPILNRRIELTALRRDRTEFPIELTVAALPQGDSYSFNAFVSDITDRKRSEAALRISEQQNASLLRLSKQLEQATTFSRVLKAVLDEVELVMAYRTVWAYLFSEDGKTASLVTIKGDLAESVEQALPILTVEGDAFLEAIREADGPVVVEDARTDPRTNKEIVAALQNRTIVNVPMLLADRKIGAFGTGSFGDEGVKVPDRHQLDYFSAMASHVAVTFDRIHYIAQRNQAEQEIRTLNAELESRVIERTAQLEAANKELEAFSYSVSHDLRSPLRHIDGFSKILLEEHAPSLAHDAKRYLTVIRERAQNMGQMIDDLLHLSRIDRQDLMWKETSLNAIVNDVIRELERDLIGRAIEWRIGTLPVAACDPGLIKLVFANLLSNAAKYTRHRTRAIIEVAQKSGQEPAVIFVSDNGAGFDQRYAHKLFGVFQRLHKKEEFEGTGVGLATVQRILTKHGGRIWAEGAIDIGATFLFTLGDYARLNAVAERRNERGAGI